MPVGSGHCSSPLPASASFRLRPWRHVCRTRFAFGFGGSARPASSGKPRPAGCGIIGLRWVVQAGSIGLRQFLGHCCLTIHSSRRRFAARLNSGVRRFKSKGALWPKLFKSCALRSCTLRFNRTVAASGERFNHAFLQEHSLCRRSRFQGHDTATMHALSINLHKQQLLKAI